MLAGLADEQGVLSIYVTVDPDRQTSSPVWLVQVRNEIAALVHRLDSAAQPRTATAVVAGLLAVEPSLRAAVDPATSGRGRALFIPLSGRDVYILSVRAPLTTTVVLDRGPYLYPLVAAYDQDAPAGIVAVGGHGIRVLDHRLGWTRDVASLPYGPVPVGGRESVGAGRGHPGPVGRGVVRRDAVDRRANDHLHRFLHASGNDLAALADSLAWNDIVVTGAPHLVAAAVAGLPHTLAERVVTADRVAPAGICASQVLAMVAAELDGARRRSHRAVHDRACQAAGDGGPGAYGLAATLAALGQGRVHLLVLDRQRRWSGWRTADGQLWACVDDVPAVVGEPVAEPDLAERMVESVYRQGGAVTFVDPQPEPGNARVPGDDGVCAVLRW